MAYKYPTWSEAPAIGEPAKKKKKKKQEKRFVGPTVEAATKGLAGPSGKLNTNYPAKMSGVSREQQMSGEWTPNLTAEQAQAQITPIGSLIAQGQLSGTPDLNATPQEATVRNINIAYFNLTGKLATPMQVLALLNSPATSGLSVEQYVKLLDGAEKMHAEEKAEQADYEKSNVGLFYGTEVKQITKYRDARGYGARGVGGMDALKPGTPYTITTPLKSDADVNLVKEDIRRLQQASMKDIMPNSRDAAMTADPMGEMKAFEVMVYQRLSNRGVPIDYDRDNFINDPAFLGHAAMYAMGPQWAYTLYGDDNEKKNANEVTKYLRSLPFTQDYLDQIGKQIGVGVADWSNEETFGMVIDAMRHSDQEFVKTAVWDAWLFGREKDTAPSQSLFDFADKFGIDKLPAAQQAEYRRSEYSISGIMEQAMGGASEAWKKARKVPWLGRMLYPIDKVGYGLNYGVAWSMEEIMKRGAVVIDLAYQGNPEIYDKGYTQQEYVQAVLSGEMEGVGFWDSFTTEMWDYNWGVFFDGSRIAAAMENNKGRNPFSELAETISVEQYGEIKPWVEDVGNLANFAAMFYLGAKVGDPLARTAIKYTGKGTFEAGRAVELGVKRELGEGGRLRTRVADSTGAIGPDIGPQWKTPKWENITDDILTDHPREATKAVTMSPDEYLALTEDLARQQGAPKSNLATKQAEIPQQDAVLQRLQKGDEVDPAFIDIDIETGKPFDAALQQGDHRALAAKQLGMGDMPVVLRLFKREGRRWVAVSEAEAKAFKFGREAAPETAVKTTPFAEPPKKPVEMPGQTEMPAGKGAVGVETATDAQGVKVAPVRLKDGNTVNVDAAGQELVQRWNDADIPTTQSHFGPEGHPKGHPTVTKGVKSYIEFTVGDLTSSVRRKIAYHAKKLGLEIERGKNTEGRSTILVRGDKLSELTDRVVGPKQGAEGRPYQGGEPAPGTFEPSPRGPEPPSPGLPTTVSEARDQMMATIFRRENEVVASIDDPVYIARDMYKVPESNLEAMELVERLAETTDLAEINRLLFQLGEHAVEIDGGAGAFFQNMRMMAYRKGMGHRGFSRFFITPSLNSRVHGVDGSTDATYAYMVANKLGMRTLDEVGWARIRELRTELWRETNALKKNNIISRIDDEIEANIIRERGSLDGLHKWEKTARSIKGEKILADVKGTAYLPKFDERGVPVEGSRVSSPGKAQSHVQRQIDVEWKRVQEIAKDASEADKAKVKVAFDKAVKVAVQTEKDIADYLRLSKKKSLTRAEQRRLSQCEGTIDSYGSDVPFLQQQGMAHITMRHNPDMLAAYMSGAPGMSAWVVDATVFQPLMTIFKETVMASLGFALKVNAGDEYTRLIAEGVPKRYARAQAVKKEMRAMGIWGKDLDAQLHQDMAMDWAGSGSQRMVMKSFDDPQYFHFLSEDLYRWGREPIVRRLIKENGGEFPQDPGDVRAFIRKVVREDSEDGQALREFLSDTYRMEGGSIDNASFEAWAAAWEERLTTIGQNPTLREAMTHKVKPDILKRDVPKESLWPVNAPENTAYVGSNWNPLTLAVKANPFHYVYQGIPIPAKIWAGGHKVGTLQMLGAMSNWLRETMFTDRYYKERTSILEKKPELAHTQKGLVELHEAASSKALNFTNHATYSTSSTMFEHMTRNLIPFGSAYRQFWQYWLATFAKHPVSMSVWMKGYEGMVESAAGLAGAASTALGGPEIAAEGSFLTVGDYQAYLPAVPFFAVTDPDAPEGFLGTATSNLPSAGFLVTGGARTIINAAGGDPSDYANIPGLAGLDKMPPFGRQGRLAYGLFGWKGWDGSETMTGLFGDPNKLEKAHVNALLDQMRYDNGGTGDGKVTRDKPWWWRATETMLFFIGEDRVKPEALFAETWKTWAPIPATATYSPQAVREKSSWLYNYYESVRTGDTEGAAKLRAEHPFLDRYLDYYDADYEGRVAMKKDPANADILKFWVSPYNYDNDGSGFDGSDWQDQWTNGRRSYKDDQQYIASIHNLYTDIFGGTYVQQKWGEQIVRKEGQTYAGDVAREEAVVNARKKAEHALKWAQATADKLQKERGWDAEWLMAQFTDPQRNWGIWPQLLKEAGKDPNQYNVDTIAKVFASGYGGTLESPETGYKVKAAYLSAEDALRALDLAQWLPDPDMRRRFVTETPFVNDIRIARKDKRDTVIKAVVDSAVSDQWYTLGSQQLSMLGVKVSPKVDQVLLDLHSDYLEFKKLTPGTDEYKTMRTNYYAKRDRELGRLKGGKLITGGVADRLIAMPAVLDPSVTLMGTGKDAQALQRSFNNFDRAIRLELKKKDPDPNHVAMAWDKLVGWKQYAPAQQKELERIAAWAFTLAEGKRLRRDLMTHYSDYYKAPGESAASKYGSARVDEFNKTVKQLRTFSPTFSKQVDAWFGADRNLGYLFLSWYDY